MYQSATPCPKCGAQNLNGTWVCAHCGTTLVMYCPHCRAANISGSKFCQSCGQPLSGPAPTPGQDYPATQPSPPYYQPPPTDYQQPPYGQYDYTQYPGGYPPAGYEPYQASGGDFIDKALAFFNSLTAKLKQIVMTTNPILLSALVVLVVGMLVFLLLAFQLGWIKTGDSTAETPTDLDTTPPVISAAQVKPGDNQGAIIYWVTDEHSSSQVQYGIWPNFNTYSTIQNDPTTGTNTGVLIHEVGITNLLPQSTYIYRCISIDKYGNKAVSADLQFQTTQ